MKLSQAEMRITTSESAASAAEAEKTKAQADLQAQITALRTELETSDNAKSAGLSVDTTDSLRVADELRRVASQLGRWQGGRES